MSDQPPPSYQSVADPAYPQKGAAPRTTTTTPYPPAQQPGGAYPPPNPSYPMQTGGPVYPPAGQATVVPAGATYMPPASGAAYGQSSSTVVVTQPTVLVQRLRWTYIPQPITCQFCHKQTVTRVEYVNGGATWLACGITALVGCFCGCCLIPFCINGAKDVQHFCPECNQIVGYRKRLD